jgi:hypothetical protein
MRYTRSELCLVLNGKVLLGLDTMRSSHASDGAAKTVLVLALCPCQVMLVTMLPSHTSDGATELCREGAFEFSTVRVQPSIVEVLLASVGEKRLTIKVQPLTVKVPLPTVMVQPLTIKVPPLTTEVPPPTTEKALIMRCVDPRGHRSQCNGSSCLPHGGR